MKVAVASTLGPYPLIHSTSLRINACGDGWEVEVLNGDKDAVARMKYQKEPWLLKRVVTDLSDALEERCRVSKKAAIEALRKVLDQVRGAAERERLVSPTVAKVLEHTVEVLRETSIPPRYIIKLDTGREVMYSSSDLASGRMNRLVEAWLEEYNELLQIRRSEFDELVAIWLNDIRAVDPLDDYSEWEAPLTSLAMELSRIQFLKPEPSGLVLDGAFHDRENHIIWVSNNRILEVLRQHGLEKRSGEFAKYLKQNGDLAEGARRFRIGGVRISAWAFSENLKIRLQDERGDGDGWGDEILS